MTLFHTSLGYLSKLAIPFKGAGTTPTSVIFGIVIPTISIAALSNMQKAFILLAFFFVIDFITGILASRVEKRKAEKTDPALREKNLISSQKLKLSAVKAGTYAFSIIGVYMIEKIFFLKSFKLGISDNELTVTLVFVAFCSAIEFYSIVFENFKRMGYDIAKKFTVMVRGAKKLISEVKEEE